MFRLLFYERSEVERVNVCSIGAQNFQFTHYVNDTIFPLRHSRFDFLANTLQVPTHPDSSVSCTGIRLVLQQ